MAENKWVGWGCFTPKEVKLCGGPLLITSFMGHFCRWWVQSYGDVVWIFGGYIWPGTQNFYLYFWPGSLNRTHEPRKNYGKEILSECFLTAIGNHPNHRICPESLCLVSYFCSGTSLLMQQEMILPIGTSLDFMGTLGTLFRNRLYSWP